MAFVFGRLIALTGSALLGAFLQFDIAETRRHESRAEVGYHLSRWPRLHRWKREALPTFERRDQLGGKCLLGNLTQN